MLVFQGGGGRRKPQYREKDPQSKARANNKLNPHMAPGALFSKTPEAFRAHKAIFSFSVPKNRQVYTPESSCVKGTSVDIENV